MADSKALRFKAKLDELTARAIALPAEASAAVLDQLRQAAGTVTAELAKADPTGFSAQRLRALKDEIARNLGSFARNATSIADKAERTMYEDASRGVTAAIQMGVGTLAVQPVVDQHLLAVSQGYTADLITGLSNETATRINGALQRAALGGANHSQLIAQVGGALEGGTFSGVFGPSAERAGNIVRNETLRIHSVASMARMTDLAQRHEGIEKEWLHILIARVPRPAHIRASGQTRPVDQPFDVGGEQLMYPRDPSGSPDNTISCHCLVRPKLNPALLKPSDRERDALARHGVSITLK